MTYDKIFESVTALEQNLAEALREARKKVLSHSKEPSIESNTIYGCIEMGHLATAIRRLGWVKQDIIQAQVEWEP